MTIKQKLLLLSAVVTFSALLILALQQYTEHRSTLMHEAIVTLLDVESDMQAIQEAEQAYLLAYREESRDYFNHAQQDLLHEVAELEEILERLGFDTAALASIADNQARIGQLFEELDRLVRHIGLTEEQGLRGELRSAAHRVERAFREAGDHLLLSELLMLRRHEKDFLLRHKLKYVERHDTVRAGLITLVRGSLLDQKTKTDVLENLDHYARAFHQLVEAKKRLGLTEDDGLRGEMNHAVSIIMQNQQVLAQGVFEAIEQARIGQRALLLIGTTAMILLLVSFSLLVARGITAKLSRITAAMEEVADGQAELSATLPEEGKGETARIARAFNRFTEKLDRTVQQVLQVATNLSEASQRAQEITQATSGAIEEQVEAIDHLSDTVVEMAESSQEVRNAIGAASDTAREVQQKANEGRQVVESAVAGMQEMQAEIESLEQSIGALTSHHEDVGQVLDMIVTIAEQTNLLALNAAIEAARAGEYGRGFAVVADEVRALSQRTTEATDEVRKLMDAIRAGNQEAVSLMERSAGVSARNLERTQAAGDAFMLIAGAVDEINERNVRVIDLADQQSARAIEVRDNIEQIRDAVRDLSELARKNISDNGDLSQFSVQLESLVAGFSGKHRPKRVAAAEEVADDDGIELF